ncbi:MAG: hypothetical protein ACI4WR_02610 [Bulleidia sp.]
MKRILTSLLCALLLTGCTGNESTAVNTSDDTNGPYINMVQYEFSTTVGNPIDFSNISGYDDVDGLLPTSVRGYVNYEQPGDYYPSIVCTDLSGNETAIPITVHVLNTPDPVPSPSPEPAPSMESTTCSEGKDPDQPCSVVLSDDLSSYTTIYEGEAGYDACINAAGGDETACEIITANDGSFWGYGLK